MSYASHTHVIVGAGPAGATPGVLTGERAA